MSKSIKDQTTRAFQVGGYNPPSVPQQPYAQPTQINPQTGTYTLPGTGIAGYQIPGGGQTGYTPYGGPTPYFQPVQFTGPQFQTSLQTTNLPTFAETVGSKPGQYDELRTYINDAGQTLQIPFKDGRPIYPIPEGYRPIGDQPASEQEQTTVTPTLGQTQVDSGGGDGVGSLSTDVPTTQAARNVYKGYSKGYNGLSTAWGSGAGGLSAAAAQAKEDFGITGQQTGSIGSLVAFIATAAGVPFALSSMAAGKGGYFIDTPVSPGAVGTLSYEDLVGIANGTIPSSAKVSQQVAKNVLDAQLNYGVNLTGRIGFNSGDINPTTGTPVKNGMAVNSAFGPGATTASYATVDDMKNVIQKGIAAGWRGGYIDKKAYDGLSAKAKENYNKFDNTHQQNDLIAGSEEAKAAYQKGNQPMQDNITGTPTSMDVDKAKAAADAATKAAAKAGLDYGDEFGNMPSAPSTPSGPSFDDSSLGKDRDFGAGQSSRGDASDTGKGSGGSSCFAAGTKFFMEDGSLKNIEDIKIGDVLQRGGKVRTTIVGDGLYEEWYMYGNTKVTGTHTVFENGTWKRVADSDKATPTEKDEFIYTLVNEKHRLIAEDGVMYGDYDEVDNLDIEDGLLEMMNLQDSVDQAA